MPEADLLAVSDPEPTPAFPERAAQRAALTDREVLDDIQLRLDRLEGAISAASTLIPVIAEAVKREGLVGIIRAIPEMMRLANGMRERDA